MSLCISPHFIYIIKKSLSGLKINKKPITKETSLCTFPKGSFTVEAAVVIPLVAGFLVSLLFFLRIIQVQSVVDEALIYAGRKVATESSITDSHAALFLTAELYFLQILEEYECVEDYVEQGKLGILLVHSDFEEEDIVLRAEYSMKFPIAFFDIGRIRLWNENRFRKWTGEGVISDEESVYISKSGEVYHRDAECRSIKLAVEQIRKKDVEKLRGADGQKYYPCSACTKKVLETDYVYYTEYGTLYHGTTSCSALKRTVTKIPLSDIGQRRPCSYCYKDK